jgi:hypothetical protein
MYIVAILISKLMLVFCGIFITVLLDYGFNITIIIALIISILAHYGYLHCARNIRMSSKPRVKVHELRPGDSKPDGIPDEVWNTIQSIMQESDFDSNEGDECDE